MRKIAAIMLCMWMALYVTTATPKEVDDHARQVQCIAATIWAEARGEPFTGQVAVAHVVVNRSKQAGDKPCTIIMKKGQFTMFGSMADLRRSMMKSGKFTRMARDVYGGDVPDPTNGATYFHVKNLNPKWTAKLKHALTVGGHKFWKTHDS